MSHLQSPKMKKMYPFGYPRERQRTPCGNKEPMSGSKGASCIIDNEHNGRPHFGPDGNGNYRQWGQAGVDKTEGNEHDGN